MMKFNLNGSIGLVTGGAGLLGRHHSLALAEIGCTVIVADKNITLAEKFCKKYSKNNLINKLIPLQIDIVDENNVKKCLKKINKKYGNINILINNAANNPKYNNSTFNKNNKLESYNLKQWQEDLNIGLTGTLICSKIFGSAMAKMKKGVIVNIASDLSVIAPNQSIYNKSNKNKYDIVKPISYSVTKTGILGITRYLSTYWNKQGIRVNSLSPGGVYVNQSKYFVKRISELIPLGRMAFEDEYKGAIQFLCSDASSYMTGQNLIIDGGRSVW